jgi:hypothetical protein
LNSPPAGWFNHTASWDEKKWSLGIGGGFQLPYGYTIDIYSRLKLSKLYFGILKLSYISSEVLSDGILDINAQIAYTLNTKRLLWYLGAGAGLWTQGFSNYFISIKASTGLDYLITNKLSVGLIIDSSIYSIAMDGTSLWGVPMHLTIPINYNF